MAVTFNEIELVQPGSKQNTPHKGIYVGNMFIKDTSLEVRPGFGQLTQLDTTLGAAPNAEQYGFKKNLASLAIRTSFGHNQFITLVQNTAFTGSISTRGQWATLYSVVIYDETTRKSWEVILHRHTAEFNNSVNPMSNWWATYETSKDDDYQVFETGATNPAQPFMLEFNSNVLFGSATLGLWAYIPSDFSGKRRQQVDGIQARDYASTYGESSLVFRVVPQDGQYAAGRKYLDTAGFPAPTDACVFRKHLVMIRGRDVYFSDPGVPNSVYGLNVMSVNSTAELTGCAECNGNLLLFSPRETWRYRAPLNATPAQGGELTKISDSIGCLSGVSKTRFEDRLVWASALGIHVSSGSYDIENIHEPIQELFEQQLSNPISHYYQNTGKNNLSAEQPNSFYDWEPTNREGVNFAYDPHYQRILIAVPKQNLILCFQSGAWSFWSCESMVQGTNTQVGALQNIQNPRILALDGEVYCVGGIENYTTNDFIVPPENTTSGSLYVLKLGYGGAVDRTAAINALEDNRIFPGHYESSGDITVERYFQLREPRKLPLGYTLPRGTVVGANDVYLFPLYLVPKDGVDTDDYHIIFDFDNTLWEPCLVGVTTELDYILPAEREPSKYGYGYGAPLNNVAEVQVYSNATFLPTVGGNRITINFNSAHGTAIQPWSYAKLNLNSRHPNPLLYLPFKVKNTAKYSSSLGLNLIAAWVKHGGAAAMTPMYFWKAPYVPMSTKTYGYNKAQPVDWLFKSDQLGLKGQEQVMARSIYSSILTHGMGTNGIYPNWIHGLYNATCSSDYKDYVSQIVDYTGGAITDDESKETLRLRFEDTDGTLTPRAFNLTTNGPRWGISTTLSKGNFLIGDEEYNTVAISDSTRGEYISWMLYGHMRDPAERLVLDSVKASIKAVSGRRRVGR